MAETWVRDLIRVRILVGEKGGWRIEGEGWWRMRCRSRWSLEGSNGRENKNVDAFGAGERKGGLGPNWAKIGPKLGLVVQERLANRAVNHRRRINVSHSLERRRLDDSANRITRQS